MYVCTCVYKVTKALYLIGLELFLTLYHTIPTFNDPEKETRLTFEQFLLFPQCFQKPCNAVT